MRQMDINRIEVTYTNGDFKAYPKVDPSSIEQDDKLLGFDFSGHAALINLGNVNFVEFSHEE